MCVVSMVSDFYRDKWPGPIVPFEPFKPTPPFIPFIPERIDKIFDKIEKDEEKPAAFHIITAEQWKDYQTLKAKAAEYDARTRQPDCVKPDVDAWEQDIEAFLILMGLLTEEDFFHETFRAGVGG